MNPLVLKGAAQAVRLPGAGKAAIDVTPSAVSVVRATAPAAVDNVASVIAKNPAKLSNFGKAVLGGTAITGVAVGVGGDNLVDLLASKPPTERLDIMNDLANSYPELSGDLRDVNNAIAQMSRLDAASYVPNLYGETHVAVVPQESSPFDLLLDPEVNERNQMLDTTWAISRNRMSLTELKALKFNLGLSEENMNVLEDRFRRGR